eukprot:TRINITY_DN14872_c0_g1_i1.p1 TRINITY_DN14872_c0_g1~~TRINITY_DN14872_c0_g1_i1.p1  ORF type:complete len:127 (+),score=8.93 TRINITY_DN14872_c0_g1_i1:21-401(+)
MSRELTSADDQRVFMNSGVKRSGDSSPHQFSTQCAAQNNSYYPIMSGFDIDSARQEYQMANRRMSQCCAQRMEAEKKLYSHHQKDPEYPQLQHDVDMAKEAFKHASQLHQEKRQALAGIYHSLLSH